MPKHGKRVSLAELAFACYIYANITDYDSSYHNFRLAISDELNLKDPHHRQVLITWLNQWGCRQFSKECHNLASDEISQWYRKSGHLLPDKNLNLNELSHQELKDADEAYLSLSLKTACIRKTRAEKPSKITIGPTGASKILFALRPASLVPWDDPIRKDLGFHSGGNAYFDYLIGIQRSLKSLQAQCLQLGFDLKDLPNILNRPLSTAPKLIDEFYWVTITNKCCLPSSETLSNWMKWNIN